MSTTNGTTEAALARHNGQTHLQPQAVKARSFVEMGREQWDMACQLADADIIPEKFRGKPANVFVALEMAHRLGIGPMEAMQNIYVVHGTPSMSAKFLIALANRSQRFRGGLRFSTDGQGESMSVTCRATDRETGEELQVSVSFQQAKTAKWIYDKKGVKAVWAHSQEQMLVYRAATFFVRRYCPEVSLGLVTREEAEELPRDVPVEKDADPLALAMEQGEAAAKEAEAPRDVEPEPQYATERQVAGLVKAFAALGVDEAALIEDYGPLDKLTLETMERMKATGAAMKRDLEEQAQREDAPEEPQDALFEDKRDEHGYSEQDLEGF